MKRTLALISEHASPLAVVGGVDAGGQNIAVAELAQHLAGLGYKIDIFTRWEHPHLPQIVAWKSNIRVIHLKAGPIQCLPKEQLLPFMPEFTENLIRFARSESQPYGLIHAHFFMSALVAAEVKKKLHIPFTVTFHALGKVRRISQGDGDKFPAERFTIEERVIREADHLVALCPQDRDDLISFYDADPAKITIIGNGFNPQEFYPVGKMLARTLLKLEPDEFIILQLGRIVPRKGIDNVVQAVSCLKKKYGIKTRLLIVGGESELPDPASTPEIGRLQKLVELEDIADQVTFTGRRDRNLLRYYYSAADVFVTTPWYEPFGITPLEAMACGTPVVGARVGGIQHTVIDGQTGLLVPPKKPEALAEKIHLLIQHPRLTNALRARALRRIHREFTWLNVAQQTAEMYEKMGMPRPAQLGVEKSLLGSLSPTQLSRSA
ncbi:glycosyltransferase family 1 protein [Larkinella knui]|uniref:Glycosyltransferase family 1 protein n=1 Tax=Larkinella knui TaxID=2025310 RepID=A0A3P1CY20_9BACT|nr:glycosyltransferase family 1 protein [Larkinella knui]RRB18129.1 glycosyltransferase family 1 protein [Larkinella knui]